MIFSFRFFSAHVLNSDTGFCNIPIRSDTGICGCRTGYDIEGQACVSGIKHREKITHFYKSYTFDLRFCHHDIYIVHVLQLTIGNEETFIKDFSRYSEAMLQNY